MATRSPIVARLEQIEANARNLAPLAARVQARHEQAHRAMIANGLDSNGQPVAPLAPSTLRRRKGSGPPRAPRGLASRVVTRCEIKATVGPEPGALRLRKAWPGFPAARWLHGGTRVMPARPMGFRPVDRQADREDLRAQVLKGGPTR